MNDTDYLAKLIWGVAMQTNALPVYDSSVNTTNCCPKFNPEGWDGQELHFEDKSFVRAETHSVLYIPTDMSKVFSRVQTRLSRDTEGFPDQFIVLSRSVAPFTEEHLFSSDTPVEGEEMVTLSGDFLTKVFEGPYSKMGEWMGEMEEAVRAKGAEPSDIYFFYTTCPKCAEAYGQNYVIGVGRI